jgi:hypothetical protein
MISGIMNRITKLGCAFAWLTIGGAKAARAAPTKAAPRCRTARFTISQYQATAVAARPSAMQTESETAGPAMRVSGANGTDRPSMTVLAMRLTPSGKFWKSEKSGLRRCARLSAVTAKNHSHWFWSWMESVR